jgi:hypothetical protein
MDGVRLRIRATRWLLTVLCLAFAAVAYAQGATGTITGTVRDNVGVVPGAAVTATNGATGSVRTTATNGVGLFRFAAMPPGRYTLRIEVQGFKPLSVEEFTLLAADSRDFPRLVLQPGGVQEAV